MKPNIILILLDGARHDRLEISQEFIELQKYGTTFNNVTATVPYTFSAMNVLFTGLYPKENGVNGYYKMFKLKKTVDFLPEILSKNGYYTYFDTISSKTISSRGFEESEFLNEYEDDLEVRHTSAIQNCLKKANGKPIFCFFQFTNIHTATVSEILKKYEWNDRKFYERKEENLEIYDTAFKKTGIYAKKIFDFIKELEKLDDTIIIFFADHGTGIGERFGERTYGIFTFEETIRTFYLFMGGKIKENRISENLLSSIDIFPTILGLCGIENDRNTPGKNLAPTLLDDTVQVPEHEFTFSETGGLQGPFPSPNKHNVFCVKNKNYKLIYYKDKEEKLLYDLLSDSSETKNLYGTELEIQRVLEEKLSDYMK
tara:strand:- start:1604 stop:2716 length:1113 start_codon:yes stop_codon:yes gene_type:complete